MFSLHLPINSTSFGQASLAIFKEIYKRDYNPCIFVQGGSADLSVFEVDTPFADWLNKNINRASQDHKRSDKLFSLWHLNGSLSSYSNKTYLFTFYELDSPTAIERNIAKNQEKVFVSSKFTQDRFEDLGATNVEYIPLFFDKDNFHVIKENDKPKQYFDDGRITFNVVGKFERRKHHQKIIQAWIKRFGNDRKYFLQLSIYNNFLKSEDNDKIVNTLTQGDAYFNVKPLLYMAKNSLYNDYLNSADIVLGMSGGEGWALPEFHSCALGKHAVVLNAHAYKSWANDKNSILVSPSGKTTAEDNMFFKPNTPFNQGKIFLWDEDAFINGCEKAIERVENNRVNEEGLKLQEDFTVEKTVDKILEFVGD